MKETQVEKKGMSGWTRNRLVACTTINALLFAIAIPVGLSLFHSSLDRDITASRAGRAVIAKTLAAAGYSTVTREEWCARHSSPPDNENAATRYQQAFDTIVPVPEKLGSKLSHVGWLDPAAIQQEYTADTLTLMETHLRQNEVALKHLRDGAKLPQCAFPADSFSDTLDALNRMERLGALLRLQIDHATSVGDWETFRNSLQTLDGFSRAFRNDPDLLAGLWELGQRRIYAESVALVLNRMSLSREQVMRLRAHYWDKPEGEVWATTLISDYFVIDRSREPSDDYYATLADYKASALLRIFPVKSINEPGWSGGALCSPAPIMLPAFTKERWSEAISVSLDLEFLERRVELLGLLEGPASKTMPVSQWHRSLKSYVEHRRHSGYTEGLWPSTYPDSLWNTQAHTRMAEIALALEQYDLDIGGLPASLEALTSNYLVSLPSDPYDGEAIRYVREEKGYLLYCVGENLIDDEGATFLERAENKTNGDVAFPVRR